ncbi:hypothetical protein NDU88_004603 [Pleurodeles waltl]|uniref:Uncharacterized protein n=1 Tax=Pleurodeles waltl TaxID=8319 RepID=A0AAV7W5F6_PLEWA|nr:hypothetical protein NDU88_004603 [Pleurodeles waltl]
MNPPQQRKAGSTATALALMQHQSPLTLRHLSRSLGHTVVIPLHFLSPVRSVSLVSFVFAFPFAALRLAFSTAPEKGLGGWGSGPSASIEHTATAQVPALGIAHDCTPHSPLRVSSPTAISPQLSHRAAVPGSRQSPVAPSRPRLGV